MLRVIYVYMYTYIYIYIYMYRNCANFAYRIVAIPNSTLATTQ